MGGLKDYEKSGVTTLDVAKGLIDRGFHPPTVYFPLIVHEALMVEPTETEPKQTLDEFVAAMKQIAQEARENKDILFSHVYYSLLSLSLKTEMENQAPLTSESLLALLVSSL